jgi:hypothetical protein
MAMVPEILEGSVGCHGHDLLRVRTLLGLDIQLVEMYNAHILMEDFS